MNSVASEKKYLSLKEASRRIPYSQDYLRLLINLGYLQGVKLGRNWFTRADWIDEYLQKYSRKVERVSESSQPLHARQPLQTYSSRYPSRVVFAKYLEPLAARITEAMSLCAHVLRVCIDYRYVAIRLALLFFTVALATTALRSPNFLDFSRSLFDKARYSVSNRMELLAHMDRRALVSGIGDFFISSAAPPSPRTLVSGLRRDLLTIFTDARVPSADAVRYALRDIFENALSFRYPSFHISLPSFSTLFGLKSPSPVAVVPPQELQTPPPSSAPLSVIPPPSSSVPSLPPSSQTPSAPSAVTQIIEKKVVVSPADVSLFQKKLDALNAYINLQVASLLGNLNDLTVKVDAKTAFTVFAQSEKIDQLQSPAILSGMTISSGDLVSQGGFSFAGDGLVKGNLQVNKALSVNTTGSFTTGLSTGGDFSVAGNTTLVGSLTVNGGITVSGPETFSGAITIPYFTATSTTATSSVAYGLTAATQGGLVGIGTSSPFAKLSLAGLGTGASTYSFAVSNAASSTNFVIQDNGSVGIGTTSPGSLLAVTGGLLATGDAHLYGPLTLPYFAATSTTATSTLSTGGFTIGTSQFIVQETSGRVGIGTTTPDAMMSIRQTVNGTPFLSAYRVTDTAPSGDFINFKTNAGATLFRVDNSGNLLAGGIVTTGSQTITSTSQPQFRVQYDSSNEITTSVGSTGTTTIGINGSSPSLSFTPQSNSVNTFNFTDALAANSVLSIDTLNRRAGIGTANPLQKLDVRGNGLLSGTLDVNGGTINFGTGSATSTLTSANGILTIPNASTTSFDVANLITVKGTGTSTFTGGVSSAGLSSSAGLEVSSGNTKLSGGLTVGGTGTSTFSIPLTLTGGIKVTSGIESTAGDLLLTGGKIVSTGVGTSTFSGGGNFAGLQSSAGLNISTGDALFSGLIKELNSGTSTFTGGATLGGISSTNGAVISSGDLLVSTGKIVSGGAGTSTYTGGVSSAGLKSAAGIESTAGDLLLTGGKIVSTGVGTSTFSSMDTSANLRVQGNLEVLQGVKFAGTVNITNGATSSFTGGISAAGLQSTANGLRVSAGDTVLAGGLQVAGGSNFTGNVGIGTAAPNVSGLGSGYTTLTIQGASGTNGGVNELASSIADADGSEAGFITFANTAQTGGKRIATIGAYVSGTTATNRGGYLNFFTKANAGALTERMRIDNAGNVGIGTAGPVAADASAKTLQIGNEYILQNVVGNQVLLSNNAYYDGTWKYATTDYATAIRQYGGIISFYLAPSGTAGSAIGANWDTSYRAMTILNNGNVGIGDTGPNVKLKVAGDIEANNMIRATGWLTGSGTGQGSEIGVSGGYSYFFGYNRSTSAYTPARLVGSTIDLRHSDSNSDLFIDTGGNVGINTAGPTGLLEVATASTGKYGLNISGNCLNQGAPTGNFDCIFTPGVRIGYLSTTATGFIASNGGSSGLAFGTHDGSSWAERMRIASSGNVGIGSTSPAARLGVVGAANTGSTQFTWTPAAIIDNAAGSTQLPVNFSVAGTNRASLRIDYVGDVALSGSGTGGTYLAFDGGTGGVHFGNGAQADAASVNSSGNFTAGTYNGQTISSAASFTGTLAAAGAINSTVTGIQTGGITRIDTSGNLTNIGTIGSTGKLTISAGGEDILLNGATSNRINWTTTGVAAPTFNSYSAGVKQVLYDSVGAAGAGYTIGIESSTLFQTVNSTAEQFKWYGGITQAMLLSGTGNLTLGTGAGTLTSGAINGQTISSAASLTGTLTLPGYVSITGAQDGSGNLRFSAANPYISASSYIVMPGGLYVSGGTLYAANQANFRGGIANDTAAYLTVAGGTSGYTYFSGNVGIGTASPGAHLDVSLPADNSLGLRVNDANGYGIYLSDENTLNFNYGSNAETAGWINYQGYNNGSTQFRDLYIGNGKGTAIATFVGSTGDVGIGTGPNYTLDVNGNIGVEPGDQFYARYTSNENYKSSLNWYGLQLGNNGGNYIVGGRTTAGGNLNFVVNNTSDFPTVNGTTAMVINSNGEVAIAQNLALNVGNAYLSSGGDYTHLSTHEWYNGTTWQCDGTVGALYQQTGQTHVWYKHDTLCSHTQLMSLDASGNLTAVSGFIVSGSGQILAESSAYLQVKPSSTANTTSGIRFYTGNGVGSWVAGGYVYADSSANFGLLNSAGAWGVQITSANYVMTTGEIYPGNPNRNTQQSSYYLAGNYSGYGIYSNTSLDAAGGLYDAGNRVCSSSTCSISANFITSGNVYSRGGYYYLGGSDYNALQGTDTWLRLNNVGSFTSGVYTPNIFRADGIIYGGSSFRVGASVDTNTIMNSNQFYCNNSSACYFNNSGSGTTYVGNAASGVVMNYTFAPNINMLDVQYNGTSRLAVTAAGITTMTNVAIPNGAICVDNDGSCSPATAGTVYYVTATAGHSDVAENYYSAAPLEAGDIVEYSPTQDSNSSFTIEKATASSPTVIGIVSTAPGLTMGYDKRANASSTYPVALTGRVPVKVSTEAGPIKIGDRITLSSLAGIGMKAMTSGETIGMALENFDATGATTTAMAGGAPVAIGKITVFVNLGYAKVDNTAVALGSASSTTLTSLDGANQPVPWVIDPYSGKVNVDFAGDINMKGNALLDVGRISGMYGKWSIDENGVVTAAAVHTQDLVVAQNATIGTSDAPQGITIFDRATHQPVCVFSENGALRSESGACGSATLTGGGQTTNSAASAATTTTSTLASGGVGVPTASAGAASATSTDSSVSTATSTSVSAPTPVSGTATTTASADTATTTASVGIAVTF